MKIYLGADYRGFDIKQQLIVFLSQEGHDVVDLGAFSYNEGDDYNDPAIAVAKAVRENLGSKGILICDSAHGMTMQANRFKGVRAANCDSTESAALAREHDDANILCLSAHFINIEEAKQITSRFLDAQFGSLERRARRINRLDTEESYD